LPPAIKSSWESICLQPDDARLREERFQNGHMLAIYWETVTRWIVMRAKRDAAALRTPLFLLQAADASSPPMPVDIAAKLMNKAAPRETGGMHGLLPLHLGMRVRLLEALDLGHGLVKDAEGDVVHIVPNELDEDMVEEAFARSEPMVYLRHLPKGIWVRMEKYTSAPFSKKLRRQDNTLIPAETQKLVFVEVRTSDAFHFRNHTVTRTAFPPDARSRHYLHGVPRAYHGRGRHRRLRQARRRGAPETQRRLVARPLCHVVPCDTLGRSSVDACAACVLLAARSASQLATPAG
jgi:hypothetical protein